MRSRKFLKLETGEKGSPGISSILIRRISYIILLNSTFLKITLMPISRVWRLGSAKRKG